MSMHAFYLVLKTLLVSLCVLIDAFSPAVGGGDFEPSQPAGAGDVSKYVWADAVDTGINIYTPRENGGYRYGPSMILNTDGSLDVWCATDGPGDIWDMIGYARLYDGGKRSSAEKLALKPTAGGHDDYSTCDPGVIKFGGYYYIGYTTTLDSRGLDNDICVARSKSPDGPFEKWTGSGWGTEPAPMIEYTGDPDCFGAGEPSFVLMGDTLYIYYSWNSENGGTTRVATADATDENWPAALAYKGTCLPDKKGGDSADVKYADAYGRFIAVFTQKRFSADSYVEVWESFDGLNFRRSGLVKTNTASRLHNCGISGRADGHIGAGDPVYLGYAYSGRGSNGWATRLHEIRLSLADTPKTDDSAEKNTDTPIAPRPVRAIPDVLTVKAEHQVYNISEAAQIWVMAFDSDGYIFPVLLGTRFSGYDRSVIRIVGGRMFPVGEGTTRVFLDWHGMRGDFLVHVERG